MFANSVPEEVGTERIMKVVRVASVFEKWQKCILLKNKIRPSVTSTGADQNYTGSTDIIHLQQVNYIILPAKTQVPGIFMPCCQITGG